MSFEGLTGWLKHLVGRQSFFPHQMSFILELPTRRLLITPPQLADRRHLTPSAKMLEVGCGPGVFSDEVARRLPRGHLELFDLQQEMLDKARQKIEAAGLAPRVGYTQGDARELALPDTGFDVAFLVAVLGEISEPGRVHRALRPALELHRKLSAASSAGTKAA